MKMIRVKFILISLMVIGGFFGMTEKSSAASPVVFFSDATDAPVSGWESSATKGAAISIWGNNFGSERGSSYVTMGGVNLVSDSDYAEWGATTNPTTARSLQRITFYLNSSMSLGSTTITVTTAEGTSGTISFYCRAIGSSHIYYISSDGSDSNNGLRDTDEGGGVGPWATLAYARSALNTGDVVYVRGGIYDDEDLQSASANAIMSFRTYGGITNHNNGTENNSIIVTAYPAELVQMGNGLDNSLVDKFIERNYNTVADTLAHWTFSKLKVDVYTSAYLSAGGVRDYYIDNNIRLIGNDIRTRHCNIGQGIAINPYGDMTNIKYFGNYFHHIGRSTDNPSDGVDSDLPGSPNYKVETIYIGGGGQSSDFEIAYNENYQSNGAFLQIYGHNVADIIDNVSIHDNYIHETGTTGLKLGGGDGGAYAFLEDVFIYNNVIAKTKSNGLVRHYGTSNIYNNIFYGIEDTIAWTTNAASFIFRNNIMYHTDSSNYWTNFGSDASNHVGDHNIWYGKGADVAPTWDTSALDNADPLFTNATLSDFTLQENSPAINTGATVTEVTKDFSGLSRPQGGTYDIGAFEYVSSEADTTSPENPSGLSVM